MINKLQNTDILNAVQTIDIEIKALDELKSLLDEKALIECPKDDEKRKYLEKLDNISKNYISKLNNKFVTILIYKF